MVWLSRLRQMTLREIPFRLREQLVLRTDRLRPRPAVRAGGAPAWPWGPKPDPGREVVLDPSALLEPRALGCTVTDAFAWHRDPCTGRDWPILPSRRMDTLGQDLDPRYCWEWSRLLHASVWAAQGDPRGLRHARAFVEDNPPGMGLHWASALEAAIRIVSLARIARWHDEAWLRSAIHDHADWVARHPSRGSSMGNHRVAELSALALAGRVLQDERWASQTDELPSVLWAQLHPDGAGAEQSVAYLAFDLEWAMIALRCGVVGLTEPMRGATRFLRSLFARSGCAPRIGDSDDGRVLALGMEPEPDYVRSVTGAACLLLQEPVPMGYRPDARAQALGLPGPAEPALSLSLEPSSCTFPHGGLTVLVSDGLQVAMDHGPLGGCHLAAHGHADALSVWIDWKGPVLTGRGTGQYNADPLGRRFHRGTTSQPTVVVDGRDQSEPDDHPFLWRTRAETRLLALDLGGLTLRAQCAHAVAPIVHVRTTTLRGRSVILEDEVTGEGRHHVAVQLPLAPGLTVDTTLHLHRDGQLIGRLQPDPDCQVRVLRGGARPGLGMHSPRYGEWVEATAVLCERHARLPTRLRTILEFW